MSERFYDVGPPASDGRKVMLATTVYDKPAASYTYSVSVARSCLAEAGWPNAYYLLAGNCHVDDARNAVVRDFLASDCTDLVFIDADVSFEPDALLALLGFDCDLVGGVYPYRRENEAEKMPVRALPDAVMKDGLIEVDGLPTGFLRMRRAMLERMAKMAQPFIDRDGNPPTPLLFERDIFGDGRRSGDIRFCMNWRNMGGKAYAATDLWLGHSGSWVVKDNLGAFLRRKAGLTMAHLASEIAGTDEPTVELFKEARLYGRNPFSATEDVLLTATLAAKKADGDILEIGSGISTIAMAAATKHKVWCIEHDPAWAVRLEQMAADAGVGSRIMLCTAPIRDGWYDADELTDLPDHFAMALVDGPPRFLASRMPFFDRYGSQCGMIVCDDADDEGYRKAVSGWASDNGYNFDLVGQRCAVMRHDTGAKPMKAVFRAHSATGVEKNMVGDLDDAPEGWFATREEALAAWVEPKPKAEPKAAPKRRARARKTK